MWLQLQTLTREKCWTLKTVRAKVNENLIIQKREDKKNAEKQIQI